MVLRAIGDINGADAAGHAGDIRGRQWHRARPDDGSVSARCATAPSHNGRMAGTRTARQQDTGLRCDDTVTQQRDRATPILLHPPNSGFQ